MYPLFRLLCGSIALLSLLLTGCGFHLRGQTELPEGVEPLFIQSATLDGAVARALRQTLNTSGIRLTETRADANYHLVITGSNLQRRTATLGEGALAAEYYLIESTVFELRNSNGVTVLGPNKLTERRILSNDPNQVISTGDEERLLRRDMQQSLAARISRQLSAFNPQSSQPAASP